MLIQRGIFFPFTKTRSEINCVIVMIVYQSPTVISVLSLIFVFIYSQILCILLAFIVLIISEYLRALILYTRSWFTSIWCNYIEQGIIRKHWKLLPFILKTIEQRKCWIILAIWRDKKERQTSIKRNNMSMSGI